MLLDHIERQLQQRAFPRKKGLLNQQALGWGLHPNDATELATLLQDHGLAVSQEGSPSRLKSGSTRCSTPRSASRRSRGLGQRIRDAIPLDITPGQGLDWSKLSLVASTDELKAEEAMQRLKGSGEDDGGTPEAQGQEPAAFQMDVNSGGTVFFCLFDLPDPRPSSAPSQKSTTSAATAPASTPSGTQATAQPTIGSLSKTASQRCGGCATTTPLNGTSSSTGADVRGAERGPFRRSITSVEDEKEAPRSKDLRRSWGGGGQGGGSLTARSHPASRLSSPSTGVSFGRSSSSTENKRAASARVDASLQNVGRAGVRGQRVPLALETVPSASVMTAWGEDDGGGKTSNKDDQGKSKEEGGSGGLASKKEVQEGGRARAGSGGDGDAPSAGGEKGKGGEHGSRTYRRSSSTNSSCSSSSIIISGANAPTKEGSGDRDSSGGASKGDKAGKQGGNAWGTGTLVDLEERERKGERSSTSGASDFEERGKRDDVKKPSSHNGSTHRSSISWTSELEDRERKGGRSSISGTSGASSACRKREGVAVLKFAGSRLLAQAEQLAGELARHVGVAAPPSRVIHQVGHTAEEWQALGAAAHALRDEELQEEMERVPAALLMAYVPGTKLADARDALTAGTHPTCASVTAANASITLCEDLGRLFLLDMVLGNADRLPCSDLGWRGNPGNVLLGAQGSAFAGHVVAIDACVQRRPPAAKLEHEDEAVDRLAQLVLTNPGQRVVMPLLRDQILPGTVHKVVAASLLRTAKGAGAGGGESITIATVGDHRAGAMKSGMGCPPRHPDIAAAFQRGMRGALERVVALKGLLEMMYQRIDEWVTEFIMDMQRIVPSLQAPSARKHRGGHRGRHRHGRHNNRARGGGGAHSSATPDSNYSQWSGSSAQTGASSGASPGFSSSTATSSRVTHSPGPTPNGQQGHSHHDTPSPGGVNSCSTPISSSHNGKQFCSSKDVVAEEHQRDCKTSHCSGPNSTQGHRGTNMKQSPNSGPSHSSSTASSTAHSTPKPPLHPTSKATLDSHKARSEAQAEAESRADTHNASPSQGTATTSQPPSNGNPRPPRSPATPDSKQTEGFSGRPTHRLGYKAAGSSTPGSSSSSPYIAGKAKAMEGGTMRRLSSKSSDGSAVERSSAGSISHKRRVREEAGEADQGDNESHLRRQARASTVSTNPWSNSSKSKLSRLGSPDTSAPSHASRPKSQGATDPSMPHTPNSQQQHSATRTVPDPHNMEPSKSAAPKTSSSRQEHPASVKPKSGSPDQDRQQQGSHFSTSSHSPPPSSAPVHSPFYFDPASYSPPRTTNGPQASPFQSTPPLAGLSPPPPRRLEPPSPILPPINANAAAHPALVGGGPRDLSLTLALKAVGAEAKRDSMVSSQVNEWRNKFRDHALALKAAADEWQVRHGVERILTCGFLSGGQPVVDLYELKIRLDHMLRRLKVLQAAAVAVAPVRVCPQVPLYLGSASAADAHHVLRFLGISHIINATEEVVEPPPSSGFHVLRVPLRDVDEEDISAHFHTAIQFISAVFGVLPHSIPASSGGHQGGGIAGKGHAAGGGSTTTGNSSNDTNNNGGTGKTAGGPSSNSTPTPSGAAAHPTKTDAVAEKEKDGKGHAQGSSSTANTTANSSNSNNNGACSCRHSSTGSKPAEHHPHNSKRAHAKAIESGSGTAEDPPHNSSKRAHANASESGSGTPSWGPSPLGSPPEGGKHRGVLVHCSEGKSRSVALVVAFMVVAQRKPLANALQLVRSARPQAAPNAGFCAALVALEKQVLGSSSVSGPGATGPVARAAQSILGAKKPKPKPVVCPICSEAVGLSSASLNVHFKSKHPREARAEAEARKAAAAEAEQQQQQQQQQQQRQQQAQPVNPAVANSHTRIAASGDKKSGTASTAQPFTAGESDSANKKASEGGPKTSSASTSSTATHPPSKGTAPSKAPARHNVPVHTGAKGEAPSAATPAPPQASNAKDTTSTDHDGAAGGAGAGKGPQHAPQAPSPSAAAATAARRVAEFRAAAARAEAKNTKAGEGTPGTGVAVCADTKNAKTGEGAPGTGVTARTDTKNAKAGEGADSAGAAARADAKHSKAGDVAPGTGSTASAVTSGAKGRPGTHTGNTSTTTSVNSSKPDPSGQGHGQSAGGGRPTSSRILAKQGSITSRQRTRGTTAAAYSSSEGAPPKPVGAEGAEKQQLLGGRQTSLRLLSRANSNSSSGRMGSGGLERTTSRSRPATAEASTRAKDQGVRTLAVEDVSHVSRSVP